MNIAKTIIETPMTAQERIKETLKKTGHDLTALLNAPEVFRTIGPELERDIIAVISKVIAIRYKLEDRPALNFRPCKFQN